MKRFRPRNAREIDQDIDSIITKIRTLEKKQTLSYSKDIEPIVNDIENVKNTYCKKEECCCWEDLLKKIFGSDVVDGWKVELVDVVKNVNENEMVEDG